VGQGEQEDMGFLRRGFIKSSSSSLPLANCGVLGGGCSSRARPLNSAGGPQFFSPLEWFMFCSSIGFRTKEQEAKTVACLSKQMRSICGWIRLRVVSFRSFRGLGVGFFLWVVLGSGWC
jgi:hypothetical protein